MAQFLILMRANEPQQKMGIGTEQNVILLAVVEHTASSVSYLDSMSTRLLNFYVVSHVEKWGLSPVSLSFIFVASSQSFTE